MRASVAFCLCLLVLIALDLTRRHLHPAAVEPSPAALAPASPQLTTGRPANHKMPTPVAEPPTVSATAFLLQQITTALNSTNSAAQAEIFTNQFLALIKSDPWAAAQFTDSPEAAPWRADLLRVLAQTWSATNPADAAKWIASLTNPNERDTMLNCVSAQVAQTDVPAAIQIIEQQGLNDRRQVILGNLAEKWAANDFPAALAWAQNYPPGDARDQLLLHLALTESASDPAAAADLIATQISPGQTQDEAAYAIADRWAWLDPITAQIWVDQFPDTELKTRTQTQLTRIAQIQITTLNPSPP